MRKKTKRVSDKIDLYFFYAEDCQPCQVILQSYLPSLKAMFPSLKASAFSYLILYNVMFIVPLLTIFGVVCWGVTSEQLAFSLKKRTAAIKLITALLFLGLAAILILNFL